MVQAGAVLTQLVYNHALRVRVKADIDSTAQAEPSTAAHPNGSKNLTGKLFNLATSDVQNVLEGREFLELRMSLKMPTYSVLSQFPQCSHHSRFASV